MDVQSLVMIISSIIMIMVKSNPKNGSTSSFFSIRSGPGGVLTASRGRAILRFCQVPMRSPNLKNAEVF